MVYMSFSENITTHNLKYNSYEKKILKKTLRKGYKWLTDSNLVHSEFNTFTYHQTTPSLNTVCNFCYQDTGDFQTLI